MGEQGKAKIAIEQSIEIYKQQTPPHSGLAVAYSNLATIYYSEGDCKQAISNRLKSLNILKKFFEPHDINVLLTDGKLGMDYRRIGNYTAAKAALTSSYEGFKQYHPEGKDNLSWAATLLGEINRLLGNEKQAEFFLQEGVKILEDHFGPDHIHTDWARIRLGQFYTDIERYQEAQTILERCFAGYQKAYGNIPNKMAWVYHPLALVYTHLEIMDKALEYFTESQKIYAQEYGETHTEYAIFLKDFALYYIFTKEYDRAKTMLNKAFAILNKAGHMESYRCLEYLGDLYKTQNLNDKALVCYQQAQNMIRNIFPENSFHKARIQSKIQGLGITLSSL